MKIRPKIENTALRPLFGPAVKHTSPLKMAVSGSFLASSLVDFGRKRLCKLLQALLKEVPSSFIDYSLFWMDTCISNLCKFLGPRVLVLGLKPQIASLEKPCPPCGWNQLPMLPSGRNPLFRALGRDFGNARKAHAVGCP